MHMLTSKQGKSNRYLKLWPSWSKQVMSRQKPPIYRLFLICRKQDFTIIPKLLSTFTEMQGLLEFYPTFSQLRDSWSFYDCYVLLFPFRLYLWSFGALLWRCLKHQSLVCACTLYTIFAYLQLKVYVGNGKPSSDHQPSLQGFNHILITMMGIIFVVVLSVLFVTATAFTGSFLKTSRSIGRLNAEVSNWVFLTSI